MKKAFLAALCGLILLTGCSYENTEKKVVNLTVNRIEKESHWTGKFHKYEYNIYFDIGNGEEWKVNDSELFDLLEKNDTVSVLQIDYLKDGKIVKTEYEFIN